MNTNQTILGKYKLQIIVIERPYDTYRTSELTRKFMTDIFHLKMEGYCSHYPYGIMPVSDYDFMATHVCLTLQTENGYVPISAFKSIDSNVCDIFRVPFPAINSKFGMFKNEFPVYVEALQDWEERIKSKNEVYAYNASWTMKTDLPKDLRDFTREISKALFYFYYSSAGIKYVMNSTSAHYGVNKIQESMGLEYLTRANGETLPTFISPVFFGEPFYLMYLGEKGYSKELVELAEQYKMMWKNRMVINGNTETKRKAA
jgi:hypothetical protein